MQNDKVGVVQDLFLHQQSSLSCMQHALVSVFNLVTSEVTLTAKVVAKSPPGSPGADCFSQVFNEDRLGWDILGN